MEQPREKRRRMKYLEPGEVFSVPRSTVRARLQRNVDNVGNVSGSQSQLSHTSYPSTSNPSPFAQHSQSFEGIRSELGAESDAHSSENADMCAEDPNRQHTSERVLSEGDYEGAYAEGHSHSAIPRYDEDPLTDASEEIIGGFLGDIAERLGESSGDELLQSLSEGFTSPHGVVDVGSVASSLVSEFEGATLPNGTVTKAAALALIMSFITSHGLTWDALDNLLRIINVLFGSDVLPRTKHLMRKLWACKLENAHHYYYCDLCECLLDMQRGHDTLTCGTCHTSFTVSELKANGHFFIILDLPSQVRHVITKSSDKLFANLERLNQESSSDMSDISDITNGSIYKTLKRNGSLKWGDLTMTFNTDGSPVFKSSKSSVWPLQFVINEVPTSERFSNTCLAGLWFGKKHPNMALFLGKFVDHLERMPPLLWSHNNSTVSSNVYAICCCVDAPARAAVQNQVLFSGFFSCPWCVVRGEYADGAVRFPSSEPGEERVPERVIRDMELAVECATQINGFKGPSPLINLRNYDIVWGQATEYMHSVLLGVARQLTEYILDSSNSTERFYIGSPSSTQILNKRLKVIKPPHCITRLPRSLSERCHWKANEWRNWLLYYSAPCLDGVLPQRNWSHWCLLVRAIWMLNTTVVPQQAITNSESLLKKFVDQAQRLYGSRMMTFNMHQLLHLPRSVSKLGPLWAHSAFVFESGNGRVVSCINAAKGAPHQVLERVAVMQEVELLCQILPLPQEAEALCQRMLGYPRTQAATRTQGASLLGRGRRVHSLSAEETRALERVGCCVPVHATEYLRLIYSHTVYTSEQYRRAKRSNSTAILTRNSDFYIISRILEVTSEGLKTCILLCKRLIPTEDDVRYPSHIVQCFVSSSGALVALPVTDLSAVCMLLDFRHDDRMYVCTLANDIERD
ncbi:uncharacterized protein LOC135378385 [Ornithodoros turicata]|uniref:uncharacterized protein LOC135374176 n=1 Tax=Ornithodoros turicata TaxID=34597 RepID=UPI003138E2A6